MNDTLSESSRAAELRKRRAQRPLKDLTEDELRMLAEIGGLVRYLKPEYGELLSDLGQLAVDEEINRELLR